MLVVLLKKDYNTRVAEIGIKVSSLDGKITENKTKNESIKNKLIVFIFRELYSLMEEMVLKLI